MVFSSITFLFYFLPAVLVAYHLAPRRWKNGILLLSSLAFYAWGVGWLVAVLCASIAINFALGLLLERAMDAGRRRQGQLYLALAVVMNIGLLGWFKYANFAVAQVNSILQGLGLSAMPWAGILLPIGISFYTFHSLSYLIDIFRGAARHLPNPVDFALYITLFPQLVAGPIVRFHEIRDQLTRREQTSRDFALGVYRFSHGLGKKVIIADSIAPVVNAIFATSPAQLNTVSAALGLVAYAVQLYFDFSGYSDMALGLGRMFGFRLPENFDRPYASRSITEFWRRWHMSLSRWFRDYLYIPLGGNRGSHAMTYRNLVLVFLATGLWHGANWTFLIWGAYHGVLLLIERARGIGRTEISGSWAVVAQARTVILVVLGWSLFRSPDLSYALGYLQALLRPALQLPADVALAIDPLAAGALLIGTASVLLPRTWVTGVQLWTDHPRALGMLRAGAAAVVLPIALGFLIAGNFSPFLYFQF